MKLARLKTGLYSGIFFSILMGSAVAGHTTKFKEPAIIDVPGKTYVGIFFGDGSSQEFNARQFGTAFFSEAVGGPLAVNAFGDINGRAGWFGGLQVGYQAKGTLLNPGSLWMAAPAIELEGYAFGHRSFTGDLINETARLPEHDFAVSYSIKRQVFLTNFVLNITNPCYLFHPYVGVGLGGGLVKISGADATQIAPLEAGINHYNASTSDTSSTFAGQIKAGVSYDINEYVSLFAEYRWLYLSSTHFSFGSTVYPTHAETSEWTVKLDPQHYNLGVAGIRFNI